MNAELGFVALRAGVGLRLLRSRTKSFNRNGAIQDLTLLITQGILHQFYFRVNPGEFLDFSPRLCYKS